MSNMIQELTNLVSPSLLKSAASSLGESESGITKAIGGLAPTMLAGMLNKSNDASAFGKIFDMISNKDNHVDLGNMGALLGGSNPKSSMVEGLLGTLFGGKTGGILDMITSFAGLKKSSSSSLMGMVAPMIMTYLGKKVLGGGLDALGLSKLLGGQRNNIAAALPGGMGDMLGFAAMPDGGLGDIIDSASDAVKDAAASVTNVAGDAVKGAAAVAGGAASMASGTAKSAVSGATGAVKDATNAATGGSGGGMGFMKFLIPLLLIAGAIFGYKQCAGDVSKVAGDAVGAVESVADKATDVAGDAVKGATDLAGDAVKGAADMAGDAVKGAAEMAGDAVDAAGSAVAGLGAFFKRKIGDFELNIPKNGIEDKFISFIEGDGAISKENWINFDRINFATGSSNLDAESGEQINNIAQIMKAFPKVQIKIGGYTDNTGSEETNMKLSQARANAVMNALVAKGVAAARMTAEGYGPQHPVATNDTPEGRAQNRRIAINVTAK